MNAIAPSDIPIAIVMGSQSDWETMKCTADVLDELGIAYSRKIISAHRTPDRLFDFSKSARDRGYRIIIAGAGGAAHLPGMIAAITLVPVLGVPIQSKALQGHDSLLSIVQMPAGIPVGTLAIGQAGATNAALMGAAILALDDNETALKLNEWRTTQSKNVPLEPKD